MSTKIVGDSWRTGAVVASKTTFNAAYNHCTCRFLERRRSRRVPAEHALPKHRADGTQRSERERRGRGGVCERGRGGVGGGRDGELRRSSCWTGGRQGERERETEGGEVVTFSTSCSGGVVGVPLMPEGTYLRLPCQSAG